MARRRGRRRARIKVESIEEFMIAVSCYDFRAGDFENEKEELYIFARRIMERHWKGELHVMHLSYLKPIGINSMYVSVKDKDSAKALLAAPKVRNKFLDKLGFPYPYYVDRIFVITGGTLHIWWHIPPGLDKSAIIEWAERRGGIAYSGWRIPVHTCKLNSSEKDIEELGKRLDELLNVKEPVLRTKVLAFVLLAALDKYKLGSLQEAISLEKIAEARNLFEEIPEIKDELKKLEKLRWRYVSRYYNELSRSFVLGRYRIYKKSILDLIKIAIYGEDVDRSNARMLYGFLAFKGNAGHVFYSDDGVVFTSMLLDKESLERASSILDTSVFRMEVVARISGFPFPYELYNPIEDSWEEEPVPNFMAYLRKLRLVHPR